MDEARGQRLRDIRDQMELSQKAMADRVGISPRGWQEIEKGTNPPSGDTLLKIAALGYSPTWILTGKGNRFIDGRPSTIDPGLLERLDRIVTTTYKSVGQVLPPNKSAGEAASLYNELLEMAADPTDAEELELILPQLQHRLKRRLVEAATAPGTGKREAS